MTNLAIIHAGPVAPHLKKLLQSLDAVGIREEYFMCDLVSTLRYEEEFSLDMNSFMYELIFGEFYKYQLSKGHVEKLKINATEFIDNTAVASKHVLKHLHETLMSRGLYTEDGKFPYEYYSFDGRVISLRGL